ncbi:MAG: hypothetical protein ABSH52_12780 [Terriglobia bacterium]|jgi:hypothetical protein
MFVRTVAEAGCLACIPAYELLRPMLVERKRQHPKPQPGPPTPDDPELLGWPYWASRGGNVPSFVRTLVEAEIHACAGDHELLRPALLKLKGRYPEP